MHRTKFAALALCTATLVACSSAATPDESSDIAVDETVNPSSFGTSQSFWRVWRHRLHDAGGSTSATDAGTTPTASDAGTTPTPTPSSTSTSPTPTSTATSTSTSPTPTPPPPTTTSGGSARIAGCDIYPADNAWNRDVSGDPLNASGATYIANMAPTGSLHADWGTVAEQYGMPINAGPAGTPLPITWTTSWGPSESDKLACPNGGGSFCYPIPSSSKIEGGPSADATADRHLLFLDTNGAPSNCTLYELYMTQNYSGGGWTAGNGAIFHLGSNALRPDGWTSGDAAGLPILPGLVRYDEVAAGEIKHALRFTMKNTQQAYIHPATHAAGRTNSALPPMGLRLRLKASVDISGYSAAAQVILKAMKKYGIILADNGSNWYFTGETSDGWSSIQGGINNAMSAIHGSDFEVVESGALSTNNL
jgi:hypothetical protein